jgi:TolB protein
MPLLSNESVVTVTIENQTKKGDTSNRMPILIGILNNSAPDIVSLAQQLKQCLEISKQFNVTVEPMASPKTKQEITKLLEREFAIAFFINTSIDNNYIEWRMYDTMQAAMVKGKKIIKSSATLTDCAYILANDMWRELMGQPGPFLSKLAYIKKIPNKKNRFRSQLCMCDYNGDHERVLFDSSHIIIAPAWGPLSNNPYLVYSEFTRYNVRLMSIDLHHKRKVVVDFDGTNAGVSFTADGKGIVYGRSGGLWKYHYNPATQKGFHELLVKDNDVCASPTLLSNGDVIYCSQGMIKRYLDKTHEHTILVKDGYNVGPTFHEPSGTLVFSRRVKGTMQLFAYSISTKTTEQLTFGPGDKTDPALSPCGTWVAYCLEQRGHGRIMVMNIKTGHAYAITPENNMCRYPTWSPFYK